MLRQPLRARDDVGDARNARGGRSTSPRFGSIRRAIGHIHRANTEPAQKAPVPTSDSSNSPTASASRALLVGENQVARKVRPARFVAVTPWPDLATGRAKAGRLAQN